MRTEIGNEDVSDDDYEEEEVEWLVKSSNNNKNNFSSVMLSNPRLSVKCTSSTCYNQGLCIDQWVSPVCDCDLTSFTGPTCADGTKIEHGVHSGSTD